MRFGRLVIFSLAIALLIGVLNTVSVNAASTQQPLTLKLERVGTSSFASAPMAADSGLPDEIDSTVNGGDSDGNNGSGPWDGFTSYVVFGSGRPRWGDYGAAAVDGSSIWIASEYVAQTCTYAQYLVTPIGQCNATRGALGNWSTHISKLTP